MKLPPPAREKVPAGSESRSMNVNDRAVNRIVVDEAGDVSPRARRPRFVARYASTTSLERVLEINSRIRA